ncbi:hypothetical protein [Pseudoalteromonas piscicida]|uniref:hypothetical protein n=1 Tax=Pseudoalteromonas piscicida TaxID=43662 RepID=UPI0032C17F5E
MFIPTCASEQLSALNKHKESQSMGFISDTLNYGYHFRTLNVLDDYNRQVLAIEVDKASRLSVLSEC